jgi:hypothetical protein
MLVMGNKVVSICIQVVKDEVEFNIDLRGNAHMLPSLDLYIKLHLKGERSSGFNNHFPGNAYKQLLRHPHVQIVAFLDTGEHRGF